MARRPGQLSPATSSSLAGSQRYHPPAVADHPVLSVLFMAGLAVVVAICSEADAFVAASLNQFSPVAQLVFMVVGPVLDVKLFSMQVGTFGHRFAVVFAPLTFVVALGCAVLAGQVLL